MEREKSKAGIAVRWALSPRQEVIEARHTWCLQRQKGRLGTSLTYHLPSKPSSKGSAVISTEKWLLLTHIVTWMEAEARLSPTMSSPALLSPLHYQPLTAFGGLPAARHLPAPSERLGYHCYSSRGIFFPFFFPQNIGAHPRIPVTIQLANNDQNISQILSRPSCEPCPLCSLSPIWV